jgi:bis(5'-nucleosyl)-tetraphosphatase (symmetrical)
LARYAVGDIHGCLTELMHLLSIIGFNPGNDTIYFVGDLVNRGPNSLGVLQYLYQHQHSMLTVIGNHDLYLLALYYTDIAKVANNTLQTVLHHNDSGKLMEYLRHSPLVLIADTQLIVHAGVHPILSLQHLLDSNKNFMDAMVSSDFRDFITSLFNECSFPAINDLLFVVNSCTRMRYLEESLALDFMHKTAPSATDSLKPWFDYPSQIKQQIIFGHWSALGLRCCARYCAIDTGCVWNNMLTAINLDTNEIIQICASHNKHISS